jgi:hypothetical protein
LKAVDRLSFDEIYHLGSRARAFLGNSCGIVFYRANTNKDCLERAKWGLNSRASENVFGKHIAINRYPG